MTDYSLKLQSNNKNKTRPKHTAEESYEQGSIRG